MDELQFEEFILVPSLQVVNLYSPAAHILVLGTFLVESGLRYTEQVGPGTAMGFGQMEEATYQDILRYLNRLDKARLKESCLSACFYVAYPPSSALMHNIRWAVITSRLKYYMSPRQIPSADDAEALTRYYLDIYNTTKGKSRFENCIGVFQRLCKKQLPSIK